MHSVVAAAVSHQHPKAGPLRRGGEREDLNLPPCARRRLEAKPRQCPGIKSY